MKTRTSPRAPRNPARKLGRSGGARLALLAGAALLSLCTVGGFWLYHTSRPNAANTTEAASTPATGVVLTDTTIALLQKLETPVDVRFYRPADASLLPEPLSAYAGRVTALLAEYERVAGGKIRLATSDAQFNKAAKQNAIADGIIPVPGMGGELCYFGIALANQKHRETIAQLAPEWEVALESDLSRALLRLSMTVAPPSVAAPAIVATPLDPELTEELQRAIPNLAALSLTDAAQVLREQTLAEFKAATTEMQTQLAQAREQLPADLTSKSPAEQQAVLQELQQVQATQTAKLKAITARLQARMETLERLKGKAAPAPGNVQH